MQVWSAVPFSPSSGSGFALRTDFLDAFFRRLLDGWLRPRPTHLFSKPTQPPTHERHDLLVVIWDAYCKRQRHSIAGENVGPRGAVALSERFIHAWVSAGG